MSAIAWVKGVAVKMTAQPAKPLIADDVPAGLKKVSNVVAVSSCKVAEHLDSVIPNVVFAICSSSPTIC